MELGKEVLEGEGTESELVAIMGLFQAQGQPVSVQPETIASNTISEEGEEVTLRPVPATTAGRIIVYGDSNCADNSHMQKGLKFNLF